MTKSKRKTITAIFTFALVMCLSITVFAATTTFSGSLPANQGDTEISKVRKANSTTKYFTITISSIGKGTNKVCAWTEGSWGGNYSSPYNQVGIGTKSFSYYKNDYPKKGDNVILNLDNPVYMSSTVSVSGSWNPH